MEIFRTRRQYPAAPPGFVLKSPIWAIFLLLIASVLVDQVELVDTVDRVEHVDQVALVDHIALVDTVNQVNLINLVNCIAGVYMKACYVIARCITGARQKPRVGVVFASSKKTPKKVFFLYERKEPATASKAGSLCGVWSYIFLDQFLFLAFD